MNATQAMKVYRKGVRIQVGGPNGGGGYFTIEGTSLGMEIARGGRHRKLVLYVKFHGLSSWFPHYVLEPPE